MVVVGKPTEGPRYRWEDNTKMGLEELGWEVVDWICLLQDKDQKVGSFEHSNKFWGSIKCGEILE